MVKDEGERGRDLDEGEVSEEEMGEYNVRGPCISNGRKWKGDTRRGSVDYLST